MKRIIARRPAAAGAGLAAAGRRAAPAPSLRSPQRCADGCGSPGVDGAPDLDDGDESALASASVIELAAAGGAGERLDRFLATRLPDLAGASFGELSRTRVQHWIALGAVLVDGRVAVARTRLAGFESIVVVPQPREADAAFVAEAMPLTIVWRDPALFVVDKPAGLVVHPAAGNWHGTLLNGLLHLDPSLAELPRAGIVHRLDKDTSGLLVVARTEGAMAALSAQLAARSMGRHYLALVAGSPPEAGTVDAPIGRDERSRIRMAVVRPPRGRPARTHYRRLASGSLGARAVTLLECRLETGRTHQIRVHLAHLGFPLIGDSLYGGFPAAGFGRQALHARRLSLLHPLEHAQRSWLSPLPADLSELLGQARIDPAPWATARPADVQDDGPAGGATADTARSGQAGPGSRRSPRRP